MAMRRQHVLLVPGFFGFANLGDFAYFAHVRDFFVTFMRQYDPLTKVDAFRVYRRKTRGPVG